MDKLDINDIEFELGSTLRWNKADEEAIEEEDKYLDRQNRN